jgi:hypothetical protein
MCICCSKRERVEVAVSDVALVAVLAGLRQVNRRGGSAGVAGTEPPAASQLQLLGSALHHTSQKKARRLHWPRNQAPADVPGWPALSPQLAGTMGWAWLAKTYVVPYLVVNFWLVTITLLQHTHPGKRAALRCAGAHAGPSIHPSKLCPRDVMTLLTT